MKRREFFEKSGCGILGMMLAQWLGFGLNSMSATFVAAMVGGSVTAFIFATLMHLLIGWYVRRRQRL